MKYFLDTEFLENGPDQPIHLLSIAMVAEDGREFYAVNADCPADQANDWVKANVLPHINPADARPLYVIRQQLLEFITLSGDEKPEFWAWYADYDWVVFCQIFGTMAQLPKSFPMFCRDLKQLVCDIGNPTLPKQPDDQEHHALNDARWVKAAYEHVQLMLQQPINNELKSCAELELEDKRMEEVCAVGVPVLGKRLTDQEHVRLEKDFTYHPPKGDQADRYGMIRDDCKRLAARIMEMTPASREQSLALTKIEEAVFWANAAIARNEVKADED